MCQKWFGWVTTLTTPQKNDMMWMRYLLVKDFGRFISVFYPSRTDHTNRGLVANIQGQGNEPRTTFDGWRTGLMDTCPNPNHKIIPCFTEVSTFCSGVDQTYLSAGHGWVLCSLCNCLKQCFTFFMAHQPVSIRQKTLIIWIYKKMMLKWVFKNNV